MENLIAIIVTIAYVICLVNSGLVFFYLLKMFEVNGVVKLFTISFIMGLGLISNL